MADATKTIAVLRRGASDSRHIIAWLKRGGHRTVDVCAWRDVRLLELTDDGVCRVFLSGIPIQNFDAILYLGTPGVYEPSELPQRDIWYRNAERTAGLLAALSIVHGPRIINAGAVLLWSRQLIDPVVMLRRLAGCGWRTPAIRHDFRVRGGGNGALERDADAEQVTIQRIPEPPAASRHLIVFTRSAPPVIPADAGPKMRREVTLRADATAAMMRGLALDWLTVAAGSSGAEVFAYGAMAELPQSLPATSGQAIIDASLA